VTTTAGSAGKFEVRFYHQIFENELGRVQGHFGPVHTCAFSPDGRRCVPCVVVARFVALCRSRTPPPGVLLPLLLRLALGCAKRVCVCVCFAPGAQLL
jgi:hypothetical protein